MVRNWSDCLRYTKPRKQKDEIYLFSCQKILEYWTKQGTCHIKLHLKDKCKVERSIIFEYKSLHVINQINRQTREVIHSSLLGTNHVLFPTVQWIRHAIETILTLHTEKNYWTASRWRWSRKTSRLTSSVNMISPPGGGGLLELYVTDGFSFTKRKRAWNNKDLLI